MDEFFFSFDIFVFISASWLHCTHVRLNTAFLSGRMREKDEKYLYKQRFKLFQGIGTCYKWTHGDNKQSNDLKRDEI